MQHFN